MSPWPFSLPGPEFLAIYNVGLALAVLAWWLIRERQRGDVRELVADPPLDAYHLAYLRGGRFAVIDTALVGLRRARKVVRRGSRFAASLDAAPGGDDHPVERAVLRALTVRAWSRLGLVNLLRRELSAIGAWLMTAGWLVLPRRRRWQSAIAKLPLAVVGVLGIAVLAVVGPHEGASDVLAIDLLIVAALVALLPRLGPRTARGDAALARYRRRYDALLRTATVAWPQLEADELVLAYALGNARLTGAIMLELESQHPAHRGCGFVFTTAACGVHSAEASDSDGSSCGAGTSGGGGDGGCGGGGCGGCGGGS